MIGQVDDLVGVAGQRRRRRWRRSARRGRCRRPAGCPGGPRSSRPDNRETSPPGHTCPAVGPARSCTAAQQDLLPVGPAPRLASPCSKASRQAVTRSDGRSPRCRSPTGTGTLRLQTLLQRRKFSITPLWTIATTAVAAQMRVGVDLASPARAWPSECVRCRCARRGAASSSFAPARQSGRRLGTTMSPLGRERANPALSYPRYSRRRRPSSRKSARFAGPTYPTIPHMICLLRFIRESPPHAARARLGGCISPWHPSPRTRRGSSGLTIVGYGTG